MKATVTVKGKNEVHYFDHIIACGILNLTNNEEDFIQSFKNEKLDITYRIEDEQIKKSSDVPNIIKSKVIARFYKRSYNIVQSLSCFGTPKYDIQRSDILDHEEEYNYELDFNYDPEKFTEICIHQLNKTCPIIEVIPRTNNIIAYYVNAGIMNLEESKEEYSNMCIERDKRNEEYNNIQEHLWDVRADIVKEHSSLKYKFNKLIKMIFGGENDK